MLKEDELIGAIAIYPPGGPAVHRQADRTGENFATQAVIAIENTRLLKELRQRTDDLTESLEQQTATSEVLKVISSSPGELEPVFQTMLENATRICGANFGTMNLYEGDGFRSVAVYNVPQAFAAVCSNVDPAASQSRPGHAVGPIKSSRSTISGRTGLPRRQSNVVRWPISPERERS